MSCKCFETCFRRHVAPICLCLGYTGSGGYANESTSFLFVLLRCSGAAYRSGIQED